MGFVIIAIFPGVLAEVALAVALAVALEVAAAAAAQVVELVPVVQVERAVVDLVPVVGLQNVTQGGIWTNSTMLVVIHVPQEHFLRLLEQFLIRQEHNTKFVDLATLENIRHPDPQNVLCHALLDFINLLVDVPIVCAAYLEHMPKIKDNLAA